MLGSRVLYLLHKYGEHVQFVAPVTAFEEARVHLPEILKRRRVPIAPAMVTLDLLAGLVQPVEIEAYEPFESLARKRIAQRDEDDWPILATALAFDCPIWTEDTDFFGCGLATWTTDRVELYLTEASESEE